MSFDYQNRIKQKLPEDPIGQLLHAVQIKTAFCTQSTLNAPWGIELPPIPNSMFFHVVMKGRMVIETPSEKKSLFAGDFVLVTKGLGHTIKYATKCKAHALSELPIIAVTDRFETLNMNGEGEKCELLCGAMILDHPVAPRLHSLMPDLICYDPSTSQEFGADVSSVLSLLQTETEALTVGSEAVITRLADVLVIKAMRHFLAQKKQAQTGWLAALQDTRIGAALQLIHMQPDIPWTLATLAKQIGMSRTSFAQRFKFLVGETPVEYLTTWRMALAKNHLTSTRDSILNIALGLGYQSESAFSRAFKKAHGASPGAVRKQHA